MTIRISSAFDGGSIRVVAIEGDTATLEIPTDAHSDFAQWFYFRVTGPAGANVTCTLRGLDKTAYPQGWPGYKARVSEDRLDWTQAETDYADGRLTIRHTLETGSAWFAYHAPYTTEMHDDLVAWAATAGARHDVLGWTLQDRAIDRLRIGEGAKQVWLYGRQHPGEPMAEWWMEGALERLLDPEDAVARVLAREATIHLVPNMCPDGTAMGHLRVNAVGANLNREWVDPTWERAPEVRSVLDAMDATGVDLAMDVHGDEAIPHAFFAGFEGIEDHRAERQALYDRFKQTLAQRTPDFQTARGYPLTAPRAGNLTMSTNQLAQRFGAVAITLEMPFKDNDDCPDPERGWSPARSKQLARDCLAVLAEMVGEI